MPVHGVRVQCGWRYGMQDHRLRAGAAAGHPDKQLCAVQWAVSAADRAGNVSVRGTRRLV